MIEKIKELLREIYNFIKKIFVKIFNFFQNIINWFRQPYILKRIQKNKDEIGIIIKKNLENGNYEIVNVLFNKEKGEIVDYEETAIRIETEELDKETVSHFKDKDMIILQ